MIIFNKENNGNNHKYEPRHNRSRLFGMLLSRILDGIFFKQISLTILNNYNNNNYFGLFLSHS